MGKVIYLLVLLLSPVVVQAQTCTRPWMFFDLGNTLVDTRTRDSQSGDYLKVFYRPGPLIISIL